MKTGSPGCSQSQAGSQKGKTTTGVLSLLCPVTCSAVATAVGGFPISCPKWGGNRWCNPERLTQSMRNIDQGSCLFFSWCNVQRSPVYKVSLQKEWSQENNYVFGEAFCSSLVCNSFIAIFSSSPYFIYLFIFFFVLSLFLFCCFWTFSSQIKHYHVRSFLRLWILKSLG